MESSPPSILGNGDHELVDKENGRKRKVNSQSKDVSIKRINVEQSFLQDGTCHEAAPKLGKCRECRSSDGTIAQKICRFFKFRKLSHSKNNGLCTAGFPDPNKDPLQDDFSLWLPSDENPSKICLEFKLATFIISQLGDQFCVLIQQEMEAVDMDMCQNVKTIAWKRIVQGVREMCDVCDTTLFNYHWACRKCGFVVCIACYKGRKNKTVRIWTEPGKDRDPFQWLFCSSNKQPHEMENLMLTQTIAGDCLQKLGKLLHEARQKWNILQHCDCSESRQFRMAKNEDPPKNETVYEKVKVKKEESSSESSEEEEDDDATMIMKDLVKRGEGVLVPGRQNPNVDGTKYGRQSLSLDSEMGAKIKVTENPEDDKTLKHFVRVNAPTSYLRQLEPLLSMTLTETTERYPNVPHSWLCAGKLLRLVDPTNPGNCQIFQEMWKRGQPVVVANVHKKLDQLLWTPESFSRDFGELINDFVNCMTGRTVSGQLMKTFWDGFNDISKRLRDEKGNPMLLKLKDWPPGEDFAEVLPSRFADLMAALPLTEYTNRDGRLNLAARLPVNFVRPDLGPKMYIAYGSGEHLEKGTTNLHLDISDAVNVLVYVGVPKGADNKEHMRIVLDAIQDSDCDVLTIKKVSEKSELAGALWHIYNSRDADKIRDLLHKVSQERGMRLEPNHDPIHDQSWYLDRDLRKRLMAEYNVSGYPIIQCLGDAVFIPAGAPHQVRNLHNCIKIAEDFVSPENVSHCFDLTEEFRNLSAYHSNHEDKLQIKNIIYHAVKDAISVLMYGQGQDSPSENESSDVKE